MSDFDVLYIHFKTFLVVKNGALSDTKKVEFYVMPLASVTNFWKDSLDL